MPSVAFTAHLRRSGVEPRVQAAGTTVREVLDSVFARHPLLPGYVLDEQGMLRQHVTIFLNGNAIRDRRRLSDAVGPDDEVFVMQALSGG